MKTVLVTGASGFIGRHVIPLLRADGWSVHAVARTPGRSDRGIAWHRFDLLAGGDVGPLLAEIRADCLLHLAWVTAHGVYWSSPDNGRWVAASLALAEAFGAAGGSHVVVAGTCAEYDWTDGICREDGTALAPMTIYGKAKLKLFRDLSAWSEAKGIPLAWGRIFHPYGPHEGAQRLIPSVIVSLLRREEARITHGRQVRGFLYASDAAAAFARLANTKAAGAFNIGSADPVTISEVVGTIASELGALDLVRPGAVPAPAGDPAKLLADNARLRGLGWEPSVPLDKGIALTIDWWRSRPGAPYQLP